MNHAVDLNSFYGYPPAINRTTGVRGPVRDRPELPLRCGDPAILRRRADARARFRRPARFTSVNHLDLAVSQTSEPDRQLEHLQDRRHERWDEHRRRSNPGPCLGDYPHIGADANGIYLTTNAYPWCGNGFDGAQIYALLEGAARRRRRERDHGSTSTRTALVNVPSDAGSTQPGFTVWPAQSPGTGSFNTSNGGTEYFLSSNAADEAHATRSPAPRAHGTSTQLVVWTLTNTSSLNSASPALSLTNKVAVGRPVRRSAKAEAARLRELRPARTRRRATASTTRRPSTIAGVGCWRLLVGRPSRRTTKSSRGPTRTTPACSR